MKYLSLVFLFLLPSVAMAQAPAPPVPTTQTVPIGGSITFKTIIGPSGADGKPGASVVGPMGPPGKDGRDGKDGGSPATVIHTADSLQAVFDAASGPQKVVLAPGQHVMSRPVFRHTANHSIRGDGERLTTVMTYGPYPWLITGVAPVTPDGFGIDARSRPSSASVLDATAPPKCFSFATRGRSVPYLTGHGLNLGRWVDGGWDYWSTVSEFTIRLSIGPELGSRLPDNSGVASGAVIGVGGIRDGGVPAPYVFGFWSDTDDGQGVAFIATRWKGDAPGAIRLKTFVYGDPKMAHRISCGAGGGRFFAVVDGVPAPFVVNPFDKDGSTVPGAFLERSTAGVPFQIGIPAAISYAGTGAAAPDFLLHTFVFLAAAIPIEPPTDKLRYFDWSGPCIGAFDPSGVDPGRLLTFYNGAASVPQPATGPPSPPSKGFAIILDSIAQPLRLGNQSVSGLTVVNANPAFYSALTYGERFEGVEAVYGVQGYAQMRVPGVSYPVSWRDSNFGGTDTAIDIFRTRCVGTNLTLDMGGTTSFRSTTSETDLRFVFLGRFAPKPDTGVAIYGGTDGGGTTISGLFADNENGSMFADSLIYCDQGAYGATSLTLDNISASAMFPTAPFLRLVGHSPRSDAFMNPPLLNARNIQPPGGSAVAQFDGDLGVWRGVIQTISPTNNVTGPGAGKVKVAIP